MGRKPGGADEPSGPVDSADHVRIQKDYQFSGVVSAHEAPCCGEKERSLHDAPARLRKLYESHDGKLCLFECGEGHLAAVDASKLA